MGLHGVEGCFDLKLPTPSTSWLKVQNSDHWPKKRGGGAKSTVLQYIEIWTLLLEYKLHWDKLVIIQLQHQKD